MAYAGGAQHLGRNLNDGSVRWASLSCSSNTTHWKTVPASRHKIWRYFTSTDSLNCGTLGVNCCIDKGEPNAPAPPRCLWVMLYISTTKGSRSMLRRQWGTSTVPSIASINSARLLRSSSSTSHRQSGRYRKTLVFTVDIQSSSYDCEDMVRQNAWQVVIVLSLSERWNVVRLLRLLVVELMLLRS